MDTFVPAVATPPGKFLEDELEARGWTHEDLASVTGISRRQVINLIQGKAGVTPETAQSLAAAFGQEAQTWMNLQAMYELAQAAQDKREVARRAKVFEKAPIRELRRRAWIPDVDETQKLESAICGFLRIDRIDDEPQMAVAARKGTAYSSHTPEQMAWFCKARELAESCSVARYNEGKIDEAVGSLRELAAYPEDTRSVPKLLADYGVRFVVVQQLRKTKVDGVAFWVNDGTSPAIALSLRYDRIDNFWFSLLHEIVHIKYRHETVVDCDLVASAGREELPEQEKIANCEAANYLIPRDRLDSFVQRQKPLYYDTRIVQFAQARGVHPGIVIGQLQNCGEIGYQRRKHLVKVREHVLETALSDGWEN